MKKKTLRSEVAQWIADRVLVSEPGCWLLLTGAAGPNGYRSVTIGGRNRRGHRAAFEAFKGAVPDDKFVCHTCDVRACVNPQHLFLGTPAQNTADMVAKGRARGKVMFRDQNPSAKFTVRQVDELRRERASGVPNHVLAKKYGVHRTTVTKLTVP
jgi:hypothetical protein